MDLEISNTENIAVTPETTEKTIKDLSSIAPSIDVKEDQIETTKDEEVAIRKSKRTTKKKEKRIAKTSKKKSNETDTSLTEVIIDTPQIEKPKEDIKVNETKEVKIIEKVSLKTPESIGSNNIEYITMTVLHSHDYLKKSHLIKLLTFYPNLRDIKTNYLGRTSNEIKNTKYKVISEIANRTNKDYIFYIDKTLGLFKKLNIEMLNNEIDLGYFVTSNDKPLSDVILVKKDIVAKIIKINPMLTPKMNLESIITKAKELGYNVETLNKYFK